MKVSLLYQSCLSLVRHLHLCRPWRNIYTTEPANGRHGLQTSQPIAPTQDRKQTLSGLQSPSWTVLCVHVQRLLATSAKMCGYVLIDSPGTCIRVGLWTTITRSLRTVFKGRMSESSIIRVLRSGVVVVVVGVFVWVRLGGGGWGGKRWKMRRCYFSMCCSY